MNDFDLKGRKIAAREVLLRANLQYSALKCYWRMTVPSLFFLQLNKNDETRLLRLAKRAGGAAVGERNGAVSPREANAARRSARKSFPALFPLLHVAICPNILWIVVADW